NKAYVDTSISNAFTSAAGGGYLPLAGGSLSGRLVTNFAMPSAVDGAANANTKGGLEIKNTDTAAGDAYLTFHMSGRYAAHLGIDRATNDLFYGGYSAGATKFRVWHAGNDGAGSGLDADLLKNTNLDSNVSGWTIAQRNGSGDLRAAVMYAGVLAGGPNNAGHLQCWNTSNRVNFRWDSTRLVYRLDEALDQAITRWGPDLNSGGVTDPGWFSIGGMIFQWGYANVPSDSSTVVNFSRGFPNACIGAVATTTYNGNLTGNQMISCHVLWTNPTGLALGSSENGPIGTFTIRYFAWGY